ncbi:hypothetical protein [Paenibacillus helianthi]|uniref:hypothetical protein n=1 Tax=Paenibacillus helianthi TaxID=1349432 RepID=UPI000A94D594|nr:hypothetical protein [Paenibacillus helianthi]
MRRLKLLLVLVLMFVALPVQGAFAASITKVIDFGTVHNIRAINIAGTGKITSIEFHGSSGEILESLTNFNYPLGVIINFPRVTRPVRYMVIVVSEGSNPTGATGYALQGGEGDSYVTTNVSDSAPDLGAPTATPTPTPTATPVPTVTPSPTPSPTATPVPTPSTTPKPSATPEQPSGDRAILTVTLINGTEKEYDLPMSEVEAFVNWYDARDAGRSPGMYAIDKHTNNKGPFKKRKDYVVFDKILTYEVSEYTVAE